MINKPDFLHRLLTPVAVLYRGYISVYSNLHVREKSLFNFIVLNSSSYLDKAGFKDFYTKSEIEDMISEKVSLRKVTLISIKVFVHWVFLILFKMRACFTKRIKSDYLVKSWIDVNFESLSSSFNLTNNSFVLVLPFPLGMFRQLKYIKSLLFKEAKFNLIGLPYAFSDYFNFLKSRRFCDLFELEYNASVNFGHIIANNFKFDNFLVMDDVEPFSYASNEIIKSSSCVNIYCKLHGIGTYSPFVFCDKMFVFNAAQADYYSHFNQGLNFNSYPTQNRLPTNLFKDFKTFDAIVFFSGAARDYQEYYLNIEMRIINNLITLSSNAGVSFFVKIHPNSTLDKSVFPCDIIQTTELDKKRMIGCSLYSTSYYSFGVEQSFLIETVEIPTTELFGSNERIIPEKSLAKYFNGEINA